MARRRDAYDDLATASTPVGAFDPADVADLPSPARRFLLAALDPGVGLAPTVLLDMEGEIRLGRWMPFRARQVLRAGAGFVWEASVGTFPFKVSGADILWRGLGTLDFRLWGLIPVARASGTDIDRSAAGRLAAETVAWAPQALTPQMGASWTPIDSLRAVVNVPVGDDSVDVTVTLDDEGRLRDVSMQRWGDPDSAGFRNLAFGARVDGHAEFGGIRIAGEGRVGWWWGTDRQQEGEFFRFRITDARAAAVDSE